MRTKDLIITRKNKIRNIISKKVVNVEIKTNRKIIIKPAKQDKIFIKGIEKQIITNPIKLDKIFIKGIEKQIITKPIKENKILIKGFKKQIIIKLIKENKIFIKVIEKIIKKPKMILIRENKIFIKGIEKIEKEISQRNDIIKLKKENSLKIIGKKIINWKMEKRPSIIYIRRSKKKYYHKAKS